MKTILFVVTVLATLIGCTEVSENNCSISDVEMNVGECNSDSTFLIHISLHNENSDISHVSIYDANNEQLGEFRLEDLPASVEVKSVTEMDSTTISVCADDHPDCCKEFKIKIPDCTPVCSVSQIVADPGECTGNNTYNLHLNFSYENAGNEFFNVFGREDKLIGYYKLADLPVTIENFEASGNDYDFIKVCINDHPDCCEVAEFPAPDCTRECTISDLVVERGECTGNNTYNLHLNFSYENAGNEFFNVFGREDKLIGYYKLDNLPVTIENFEASGNDYDFIKVCINDHPDCCEVAEFQAPDCTRECSISDLVVERGECFNDSTYSITINFAYSNPGNDLFEVYGRNNKYYGYFNLTDLPVTITDFRKSGSDYDLVKVCINDNADCCKLEEIESPNCDN